MLQCGDPTAKASQKLSCSSTTLGTGGPGYEFASENLDGGADVSGRDRRDGQQRSADTNGSQFFLVFKETTLSA